MPAMKSQLMLHMIIWPTIGAKRNCDKHCHNKGIDPGQSRSRCHIPNNGLRHYLGEPPQSLELYAQE